MRSFTLNFKRFVVGGAMLALLVYLAVRVVQAQAGYPVPGEATEPWMSDVARLREVLYAENHDPSKPTIFVVAGSNGIFGINGSVIAAATGYNVENYSLHAGLQFDLLFSQIIDRVRPGDLVVAPMEWEEHNRTLGSQFDYANYLRHFETSAGLSIGDKYRIYSSVPLNHWWSGLASYIYAPSGTQRYWDEINEDQMRANWSKRTGKELYSYMALTRSGDFALDLPLDRKTWVDPNFVHVPDPTDADLDALRKWRDYFKARGAQLMFTAPVILESHGGQMGTEAFWASVELMRIRMQQGGVPLHCDIMGSVFASVYRSDTAYHMNAPGADVHSKALGTCVAQFLAGSDVDMPLIDPVRMPTLVNARFAEQRESFGTGALDFQVRLRTLAAMKASIETYKEGYGFYPTSDVAVGWGAPAGLAPMPTDPAHDGGWHYAYWSNGAAYKLLSFAPPEDCTVVSANWPEMIDPARMTDADPTLCGAYGYWTPDQADR